MGSYPVCPPLVSRQSTTSSYSSTSSTSPTPAEIDFEGLSNRLQQLEFNKSSRRAPDSEDLRPPQPVDAIESFRTQLYLSLVPAGLLPKDAFTVDPRSGITVLQKPTAQTLRFLNRLEALWQAANFAEDIALYYMELAVADRRRDLPAGADAMELTTEDLDRAIAKMQREAFTQYVFALSTVLKKLIQAADQYCSIPMRSLTGRVL